MLKDRQLNDKEIRILKRDLNQLKKRNVLLKQFLYGWTFVALIVGAIVFFRIDSEIEYYLLIGTVLVYILIGIWVYLESYVKVKTQRKSIEFVLTENKVQFINIVSGKYIELSEIEDEGVYYLFQISDKSIVFFGGQDFYPTKEFPSNDFEIALSYGMTGEIVLLETHVNGYKISPIKTIRGQKKWDLLSSLDDPGSDIITIIDGKIEDLYTT